MARLPRISRAAPTQGPGCTQTQDDDFGDMVTHDPRVPRPPDELEAMLRTQLRHLTTSADAFDSGDEDEGVRLAATLRILLHDGKSKRTRSLFTQLGMRERKFFDSAPPPTPGNLVRAYHGLVVSRIPMPGYELAGSDYVAPLDRLPPHAGRWVPFADWWHAVVFDAGDGGTLTREELVLSVGETDGGHHIDAELPAPYARLSRGNALGYTKHRGGGAAKPLSPPHLAAVRQIAHELFKTLDPAYTKAPPRDRVPSVLVGESVILRHTTEEVARHQPGPGGWCRCGSGLKYQACRQIGGF